MGKPCEEYDTGLFNTVFKVTSVNFNDSGLTVLQVVHVKSMVHDCLTLF